MSIITRYVINAIRKSVGPQYIHGVLLDVIQYSTYVDHVYFHCVRGSGNREAYSLGANAMHDASLFCNPLHQTYLIHRNSREYIHKTKD